MKTVHLVVAVSALAFAGAVWGCEHRSESLEGLQQQSAPPSATQVPLNPLTIPKFAQPLPIPRVFAPTLTGNPVRQEYTVAVQQTTVQMLPPGFPNTTVLAYGGQVKIPNSTATEFVRSVPGPTFENVRG